MAEDGPQVGLGGEMGPGWLLRQGLTIELGWPAELTYAPEGLTAILKARLS